MLASTLPTFPKAQVRSHLLQEASLVPPTKLVLTGAYVILECEGWFMLPSSPFPGALGCIFLIPRSLGLHGPAIANPPYRAVTLQT